MPRKEATTGDSVTLGGGGLVDKGDFPCTITKFEDRSADTADGEVPILNVEFTIMGGDNDGRKLFHDFWLRPGDDRSEQSMADFLKFAGVLQEIQAKAPNGDSWLDANTVTAIKLCTHGKTITVNNFHQKDKNDSTKVYNRTGGFSYFEGSSQVGVEADSTSTPGEADQQVVDD